MKTIKKLLKYFAIFILSLFAYLLIVTLLSFVSVNEDVAENHGEIPIYILTNGVHTDIVLPIKNDYHDWSTQLKFEHTKSKDTTYQYVALGWGDKGFYLETPTWADLKASTAIKAASGLSTSAMHVTFYKHLKENQSCKKLQVSLENYKKLIAFINESFQTKSGEFLKNRNQCRLRKTRCFLRSQRKLFAFLHLQFLGKSSLKISESKSRPLDNFG